MKIGRFRRNGAAHIGGVFSVEGTAHCCDLTLVAGAFGTIDPAAFSSMKGLIEAGERGMEEARNLAERAMARGDAGWFSPVAEVEWLCPVETPSHFLCAGRNFAAHQAESASTWKKENVAVSKPPFPTGFAKLPNTLVPHGVTVRKPENVTELDYEVEIAAVIGKPALNVPVSEAMQHIFGYTVFNDLSARDWQRQEMRNQMLLFGKNFPGFAPIGPWILTADEVPDPSQLTLELRVNGEIRQRSTAADMIFSFAELVSSWSLVGLLPGDLITSGTPEGVAMHRLPDPHAWYLRPGDRVEAAVAQIGGLLTQIG